MGNVSDETWTNSNISIMVIGTIYSLIFLFVTIYNYLGYSKKSTINKVLIGATFIHMSSWLIHFCASMTTYIKTSNNRHDNHDTANFIICAMVVIHPISFYMIMIGRLHYAFSTSSYKLNKIEFILIVAGVLGTVIPTFIEQTSWILIVDGNPPVIDVELLINCLWAWIAFDVATRLLLIYLFVRKLFLIVMAQTDEPELSRTGTTSKGGKSTTNNNNNNNNKTGDEAKSDPVVLNMVQMQFLSVIKKVTLLGVFSALPLTLARVIFVIDFHANDGIFTHENWIAFNSLQCIAVFCEIISIISNFRFNERIYSIFCRYCDVGCGKCCQYGAKRKITSQITEASMHSKSAISSSSEDAAKIDPELKTATSTSITTDINNTAPLETDINNNNNNNNDNKNDTEIVYK